MLQGMKETVEEIKTLVEKASYLEKPIIEHEGKSFWSHSNKEVQPKTYREALQTQTLESIVDYVNSGMEDNAIKKEDVFIVVESISKVSLYHKIDEKSNRELLMSAELDKNLKSFQYDKFLEPEPFVIGLYSLFADSKDKESAIQKASSLKIEISTGQEDTHTGLKTSVRNEIKSGNETRIFSLSPYRTFREIKQPESGFVFRVDKQLNCALFEADGGAWRIEAIKSIKTWLTSKISDISVIA